VRVTVGLENIEVQKNWFRAALKAASNQSG